MNSDNSHTLLTHVGFNVFRSMGIVKVRREGKKHVSFIPTSVTEKAARDIFYKLVDLRKYPQTIAREYANPAAISVRSQYSAKAWFDMLNSYGKNKDKKVDPMILKSMRDVLDGQMSDWMSNPAFDFDMADYLRSGKWLTHIKTNSNSGYPMNIKQTKDLMFREAPKALRLFNDYASGNKIVWEKLPFEMGYRTERKKKHRVICMAPTREKILSSVISTMLDEFAATLPFAMPRKVGAFSNLVKELFDDSSTYYYSKDYEAYDTSIPLQLFKVLRDWFKTFNNTFATLLAFEMDLIMNAYMVVGPKMLFWIASLPSGVGVTQFIGSLLHWLIDVVFGIVATTAFYQSDDNVIKTNQEAAELSLIEKAIAKELGMAISPIGEKTMHHEHYTKFLQKIIDGESKIFYNHEQRAFTNGFYRERALTDDELFNTTFYDNFAGIKGTTKKNVLAYLGNLVSYGNLAPSISNIISFMYGKRTGFTMTMVKWGLNNLEKYMNVFLSEENHRPVDNPSYVSGLFDDLMTNYGWGNITPSQVLQSFDRLNLAYV